MVAVLAACSQSPPQAGRHEFDGQLPGLSAHGIEREIARLHDERDRIAGVDPAALTPRERFDREYLLAVVDKDLFWLEKTRMPFTNPDFYQANIDPDMCLSRDNASLELRSDWLAKTAPGGAVDDQSHWHDFHDLFLSYGGPPIPLLRRELAGGAGPLP